MRPKATFLFFIFAVSLATLIVKAQEGNARETIVTSRSGGSPEAVITIDEPVWYSSKGESLNKEKYFPGVSQVKSYAPLPVFFQGWKSEPRGALTYEWNFGDQFASAENPNLASGLNAVHVYSRPGTYTASLRVRDSQGRLSPKAELKIEVLAPSGRTFWVDAERGNDDWNGLCRERGEGDCGPWKTATKAFSQINAGPQNKSFYQPGDQIIFRRGQTFEMSRTVGIGHYKGGYGYVFKAEEGAGAKPVIQYTDNNKKHLLNQGGIMWGHVAFVDLVFRLRSPAGVSADGLISNAGYARNLLLWRVELEDPRNGALLLQNNTIGAFVVGSKITNSKIYGDTVVQLYYDGSNLGLLNNTFDLAGNHNIYTHSVDKGVIVGNTVSRPAFGRTALRVSGLSNNLQISNNKFLGWIDPVKGGDVHNGGGVRYNWRLVQIGPNKNDFQLLEDIVFENNSLLNCGGCLNLADARRVIVRNNIFSTPSNEPYPRVEIGSAGSVRQFIPSRDITIIGNTFVNSGRMPANEQGTTIIQIIPFTQRDPQYAAYGSEHSNIKVLNNIFYYKQDSKGRAFILHPDDLDALTSNNNLYYAPSVKNGELFQLGNCAYNSSLLKWDCDGREVLDLEAWQKRSGKDTASFEADPKFNSNPNILPHQPGEPNSLVQGLMEEGLYRDWLELSSRSPAINRGFSDSGLSLDFKNRSRQQGGSADIGALESAYKGKVEIPIITKPTESPEPTTTPSVPRPNNSAYPNLPAKQYLPFAVHSPIVTWRLGGFPETGLDKLGALFCRPNCGPAGKNSFYFDGDKNYLSVVNTSALNQSQALSLGAWIYPLDWQGNRRLVQKGDSDNQYRLLAEGGKLKFDLEGVGEVVANLPSTGQWHFVAGTYDGRELYLYVDGALVAKKTAQGNISSSNSDLYIGSKKNNPNKKDLFKGYMAEVSLWHVGLSPEEVRALWQQGPF